MVRVLGKEQQREHFSVSACVAHYSAIRALINKASDEAQQRRAGISALRLTVSAFTLSKRGRQHAGRAVLRARAMWPRGGRIPRPHTSIFALAGEELCCQCASERAASGGHARSRPRNDADAKFTETAPASGRVRHAEACACCCTSSKQSFRAGARGCIPRVVVAGASLERM